MSVEEFDNGYSYAAELKAFARDLGITVGNFRKLELEALIREILRTAKVSDRESVLLVKSVGLATFFVARSPTSRRANQWKNSRD